MAKTRNIDLLEPALDAASVLGRLGDDVELMEQILQIYLEDAPTLIHAAREALAKADAKELRRAAHSLKGLMATLSAHAGLPITLRLEQCAAAGDLAAASQLIHEVGQQVAELTATLRAYFASGEPARDGGQTVPSS
jgi:HPt (histidine-containing phosphotransfer) domain-containing protein